MKHEEGKTQTAVIHTLTQRVSDEPLSKATGPSVQSLIFGLISDIRRLNLLVCVGSLRAPLLFGCAEQSQVTTTTL